MLFLLPALTLAPVPIDETRYLAVAWNMFAGGHWLVPWLDGAAYPDKPPLLFWLISVGWEITGAHACSARLVEVLLAFATLWPLGALVRRLGGCAGAASAAVWVWFGCLGFSGYADAIMFDLLLTLCALVAWLGGVMLAQGSWRRGVLLLTLGLGAGILAKGPVCLLVGAVPALFAPWWYPPTRVRAGRFYAGLLLALLLAVALALAWAIPAATAGGQQYADAIFLRQTVNRVTDSFAHARAWYWYLPLLPLLLLPWPLVLGRGERYREPAQPDGEAVAAARRIDRFALAAFVPGFIAFSLISGKQPHYLLPMLPALALAMGQRLADRRWRIDGLRLGLLLAVIGFGLMLVLPRLHPLGNVFAAYACLALLVALGAGLGLAQGMRGIPPMRTIHVAVTMAALTALTKLAFGFALGPRYDVQEVSHRLAAAQRAGVPLLSAGRPAGLYTFSGRLAETIPSADSDAGVANWVRAHPDGWLVSDQSRFQYAAAPFYTQPFLGRRLSIWRAGDIAGQARQRSSARDPHHLASSAYANDAPP